MKCVSVAAALRVKQGPWELSKGCIRGCPYITEYGMGGGSRFITILHRGGLPNLFQYYMRGGLQSLLQYHSFERKMEGYNPFSALN